MKKKLSILPLSIILSFFSMGYTCSTKGGGGSGYTDLDAAEFYKSLEALTSNGGLLLDVRTQGEYDDGHLPGAVLIPVQELADRMEEIRQYKDKPVYVYCRSGNRSRSAVNLLKDAGFTTLYNLSGGISAWAAKGYPVE